MPVQRPYNPNAKRMAEMIQADWPKIGVKAKIVTYEWGEYLKRSKAGEHETVLLGWTGDNGDPDNFLERAARLRRGEGRRATVRAGATRSSTTWSSKAKRTADMAERTKLYEQAQVDLQGRGAVDHHRALGRLQADAQGSDRLQDLDPFGAPRLLRRRHPGVRRPEPVPPVDRDRRQRPLAFPGTRGFALLSQR